MKEQELISAIKDGNIESIEKLINEGVNLNYKDEEKSYGYTWTPLHHCIFRGGSSQDKSYTAIAALLLKNGADIEGVNFPGETPALFAIKYFALEIFDLLISSGANIYAVNNENRNVFDIVLDRYYNDQRLDEDHIDDEEDKAVKAAIRKGEGESLTNMFQRIDTLVKNGYDLNTGKYSAAFSTFLEVAENKMPAKALLYLFEKGANPRECIIPEDGDSNPLFAYVCNGNLPVEILVEMAQKIGLDYVFEECDKYTPLLIAINQENLALTKRLVKLGADIHTQDEHPLELAAGNGNLKIVKFLVQQGAIIKNDPEDEYSPISLAEEGGFTEVVDYLKSKI
jgi:ankyrin repeat protein